MAWKIGSVHIWGIGKSANFLIVVPLQLKKAQAQYSSSKYRGNEVNIYIAGKIYIIIV